MRKPIQYILALCWIGNTIAMAQEAKVGRADKEYSKYSYMDAVKVYERVAEKGYESQELFEKLGNSYYFNSDLPQAAKWYDRLFAMGEVQDPEYYFRYAQSLKAIGNYEKADQMMQAFAQRKTKDSRAVAYNNKQDYLQTIRGNSGRYQLEDAGINSEYSDYGTAYYANQIVFASARDTGNFAHKKHSWTGEYFTNLYGAAIKEDGNMVSPANFSRVLNTKLHESTPVFTKDSATVYFTRNNYNNGKKGKDSTKVVLLKIYKATKKDGTWGNVTELPFASNHYSVSHPTLSPDEKTMYFSSDMPGTRGASDIYKVAIHSDGTFGTPQNMGDKINTEAKETFPFVSQNNQLYFASDGHLGLGGLDVFQADLNQIDPMVRNLGAPVNSNRDDFAFVMHPNNKEGFLSSNREGGKGSDDIYKIKKCATTARIQVVDKTTGALIPDAEVKILDQYQRELQNGQSAANGNFDFDAECNQNYYARAQKEGYETNEIPFTTTRNTESLTTIPLQKKEKIKPGMDLAKMLNIIYFDLDKSYIRKDAAVELEKLVAILEEYPTVKIDIRSHTDSRQTKAYNNILSEKRAKATKNYLIKKGIAADRLTAKGYGESQLRNECADGVKCAEAKHQENRRSEFIVWE